MAFKYIGTDGLPKISTAATAEEALKSPDIHKNSGVQFMPDQDTITPIVKGSPVISSNDNQQQFGTDSDSLSKEEEAIKLANQKAEEDAKAKKEADKQLILDTDGKQKGDVRDVKNKGDETSGAYTEAFNQAQRDADQANVDAQYQRGQQMELYKTSLAAIDATTAATIGGIEASFNLRIGEQKRINQLNVDRVKAYGLSGGGRFTPISFNDSISVREEAAANKILELENSRNSLIAQAKAARDEGKSKLLSEKMTSIANINKALNEALGRAKKAADDQYTLLRTIRKEEEAKHKALLEESSKKFLALAPALADEYEGMDDKEKTKYIKELAAKNGLSTTEVFAGLEGAVKKNAEDKLDLEQKKENINNTKSLINDRIADRAVKNEDKKKTLEMDKEIPDTFADNTEFYAKRAEFVKKYGKTGAEYWDKIFIKDSVGDPQYTKGGSTKTGSVQERAEENGYDYEALKKEYTDEEIDAKLKEKGL